MNAATPHFLLFSESRSTLAERAPQRSESGRWRFVLESLDGGDRLEAADEEPEVLGDRLELLAVVRGLEALDQPSRVTLITQSRYVAQGIRFGLAEWKATDWQWERFGELRPVKNEDLWRRVDQALKFHQVECRAWKFEAVEQPEERQDTTHAPTPARPTSVSYSEPGSDRHFRVDSPHSADSRGSAPPPARRGRLARLAQAFSRGVAAE